MRRCRRAGKHHAAAGEAALRDSGDGSGALSTDSTRGWAGCFKKSGEGADVARGCDGCTGNSEVTAEAGAGAGAEDRGGCMADKLAVSLVVIASETAGNAARMLK